MSFFPFSLFQREKRDNPPHQGESPNNLQSKDSGVISGDSDATKMNGLYGHQGYPQGYPPQGFPRQGYPPQYGAQDNAYGYPAQGYNYLYTQPPQLMERLQIWNEPIIRGVDTIDVGEDLNMGVNCGQTIKHEDTNQQPDNPFPQADGGVVNKTIIENCRKITSKRNMNLGIGGGSTMITGKTAPKNGT